MSDEDVIKLVEVLGTADGGCSHCFRKLCRRAGATWPDLQSRIQAAYAAHEEGGTTPLDFDCDD